MRRITMFLITLGCLMTQGGCSTLVKAFDERPTVAFQTARLVGMDLQQAAVALDLQVSNPYPVALPLTRIRYNLASGGAAIAQGVFDPKESSVPAGGRTTLTIPVNLVFADVLRAASGVRPGTMVPYEANVELSLQPPMIEAIPFNLSRKGQLPVPAVPEVSVTELAWRELSMTRASGVLDLRVRNTNQFAMNLARFAANLSLGGSPVASATTPTSMSLSAGQTGNLRLPFDVSTAALGLQLLSMLRGGDVSYGLDGELVGSTPAGPMALPFKAAGRAPMSRP